MQYLFFLFIFLTHSTFLCNVSQASHSLENMRNRMSVFVCVNVTVYTHIYMSIYMRLCILHAGCSMVITLKYLLYEPWSGWRQARSESVKNPCPLTLQTLLMEDSLPGWQLPPLVYQWGLALKPEPLWPFGSNPLPSSAEQTMTIEGAGKACDPQLFTDKSVK